MFCVSSHSVMIPFCDVWAGGVGDEVELRSSSDIFLELRRRPTEFLELSKMRFMMETVTEYPHSLPRSALFAGFNIWLLSIFI